jgi:hypothetical protein
MSDLVSLGMVSLVGQMFSVQLFATGRSGSPGESHPEAPTEPCLTVSRYTALLI